MTKEIKTLYEQFPSQMACFVFIENILWPAGPLCPYCKLANFSELKGENRYHCNVCNSSFSVTVHTMFHKTKCDLQKWFAAILLISQSTSKIPVRVLGQKLEVTKDTAGRMLDQIAKDRQFAENILLHLHKQMTHEAIN
jgi:transposase-like protein